MSGHSAEKDRRRWSLSVTTTGGDEVRISLHPVSLARIVAEVIEDAACAWCRRRGHVAEDGHCARCGLSLPDDGSPYRAWLPDAYRTITRPGATGADQ